MATAARPVGRVMAVDWSGARDRPAVWLAEVADGRVTRLAPTGTREHAVAEVVRAAGEGPRLAAGFDFAFSYPAWFLAERGCADAFALWDLVARDGEGWLARPAAPFWTLGTRAQGAAGERAFRRTERDAAGGRVSPKSTFQVAGPGQVGTMSVRGIPFLRDLRTAGVAVWPFEPPGPAQPVAVEIYPRRLYGDAVVKGSEQARATFLRPRRAMLADEAQLDAAVASDHAFDALASALVMWEHRDALAALPPEPDPVYRREGRIWLPPGGAPIR